MSKKWKMKRKCVMFLNLVSKEKDKVRRGIDGKVGEVTCS